MFYAEVLLESQKRLILSEVPTQHSFASDSSFRHQLFPHGEKVTDSVDSSPHHLPLYECAGLESNRTDLQ